LKPVVLTFTRHYLPGFRAGGPIRSIANIVDKLGDELEFRVVTSDRDFGDVEVYPGIQRDAWLRVGKAWVRYVSAKHVRMRETARLMSVTNHDVVYLNSFFDRMFTLRALVCRRLGMVGSKPVVVAPRGEFSLGALRLKALRKRAYISLAREAGLFDDVTWQASSVFEAEDISKAMNLRANRELPGSGASKGSIVVASDIVGDAHVDPEQEAARQVRSRSPLSICFLSRITPKKNLEYALRVLESVGVPVHFAIYGPIEDQTYWASCQHRIASMPSHVEVTYGGLVEHSHVQRTLAGHDLFLLPTLGENFGHVIHEALTAGLTVLLSDQTPWRGLEEKGVGWDLPLGHIDRFVRCVEAVAAWREQDFETAAANARRFATQIASDSTAVAANRQLFRSVLSGTLRETT
jgi:glycosyltransferase involved in cell wall biosynthesis